MTFQGIERPLLSMYVYVYVVERVWKPFYDLKLVASRQAMDVPKLRKRRSIAVNFLYLHLFRRKKFYFMFFF